MNYLMKNKQLYHLDLITKFPKKQMLTLYTLNLKLTIKVLYTNLLTYQKAKYHISKQN